MAASPARTNQSTLSLQVVFGSIQNANVELLESVLARMPLDKLSVEASDNLLNTFLSYAASQNRKTAVPPILKAWELVHPPYENMSLYSIMYLNPVFNVQLLKFLASSLPQHSFQTVIDELISYDESDSLRLACDRAIQVYGEQPRLNYKNMRDSAEDRENLLVYNFFVEKLEETNDFAPIPVWVRNFTGQADLPRAVDVKPPPWVKPKFQELSVDQSVDLLMSGLAARDVLIHHDDMQQAKDILRGELAVATQLERMALLDPTLEKLALNDLQNDIKYFRILGPSNPFYNSTVEEMEYGGARMFLANEFDYDEDEDAPVDWFRGVCEKCHLKIRRRWHAVRIPLESGGWVGCYCSFECALEALADREETAGVANLAVRIMLDSLEDQFVSFGIQDRL